MKGTKAKGNEKKDGLTTRKLGINTMERINNN
jgi:hypothetical protein